MKTLKIYDCKIDNINDTNKIFILISEMDSIKPLK